MLLTEAEARTKWCPHVRITRGDTQIEAGDHPERGFCGLAGKP